MPQTPQAYTAQRLLQDVLLSPRDALQLPAQTLVNKYNMDPREARTLSAQKPKTKFGKVLATVLVKRDPVPLPEPPISDPEALKEGEDSEEAEVQVAKPTVMPGKKAAGKAAPPPPVEPPAPEELDEPLWLLVSDGYDLNGNQADEYWRLPFIELKPGENIRQTAERAVSKATSGSIDAFYELDSPCDSLMTQKGDYHFFVRATIRGGRNGLPMQKVDVKLESGLKDYAWVPKEDLGSYVTDKELLTIVDRLCA